MADAKTPHYNKLMTAPAKAEGTLTYLPGRISSYYWAENEWMLGENVDFTYNKSNGQTLSRQSDYSKTEYTYTPEGKYATVEEKMLYEEDWVLAQKREYFYDTVLPTVEVKCVTTNYQDGTVVETQVSETRITRSADGNVTRVERISSWSSTPEYIIEIGYGADGKANKITMTEYGDLEFVLEDIVWECTDGQIIPDFNEDYSDVFVGGNNRIKSGTYTTLDHFDAPVYLLATYPDAKGSFSYQMTYKGELIESVEYEVLDAYGSYSEKSFDIDFDYDDETDTIYNDGEMTYIEKAVFDEYGHELSYMSQSYDEDNVLDYEYYRKGILTLDAAGNPQEYIQQEKSDYQPEWANSSRLVYSDYVGVNGVESIEADAADAPVEYFNLQGVKVANPSDGIFIRRQGTKVSKVVVK